MKVVFDTNVFVSAAMGSRMARRALVLAYRKVVNGIISYEALAELTMVLREHLGWDDARAYRWYRRIGSRFSVIRPLVRVEGCRDPDDNKFLECAVAGKTDYVVSGDRDLLDLEEFMGVKVVSLAEFLAIVEGIA